MRFTHYVREYFFLQLFQQSVSVTFRAKLLCVDACTGLRRSVQEQHVYKRTGAESELRNL